MIGRAGAGRKPPRVLRCEMASRLPMGTEVEPGASHRSRSADRLAGQTEPLDDVQQGRPGPIPATADDADHYGSK